MKKFLLTIFAIYTVSTLGLAVSTYTYPPRLHISGTDDQAQMDALLNLFTQLDGSTTNANTTTLTNITTVSGNVLINTIGKGIVLKAGATNNVGRVGRATMVAGTSLVFSNSWQTANTRFFLTRSGTNSSTGYGIPMIFTNAVGFTIMCSSNAVAHPGDNSTIDWMAVEAQ